MLIRPEILYSILINRSVIQKNLKKLDILTDIHAINNALLPKYSHIKRISQSAKYKNNKIISELITIIDNIKTETIIKKMFIKSIKASNTDIAKNVYNILLNKWGFAKLRIISATRITDTSNLEKLNNIAEITYEQDPTIIGGNITIVNSLKIDNSILGHLNTIESQLITNINAN